MHPLRNLSAASFVGGPALHDGHVHLVQVVIDYRTQEIRGVINETITAFDGRLNGLQPTSLPIELVFLGGYPLPSDIAWRSKRQTSPPPVLIDAQAFSTPATFKGTLQDGRVNNRLILLSAPTLDALRQAQFVVLGAPARLVDVLPDTVSDNMCNTTTNPCSNDGVCSTTFNDFACACQHGWTGRSCLVVDVCAKAGACPTGTNCTRTNDLGGFVCESAWNLAWKFQVHLQ